MTHLKQLNPILAELVAKGVPITFTKDAIVVPGFYKSDTVKLRSDDADLHPESDVEPPLVATDRYGKDTKITQLDDLVELNFEWWEASRDRGNPGWTKPDPNWVPLLTEHGFIEARQDVTYVPRVRSGS